MSGAPMKQKMQLSDDATAIAKRLTMAVWLSPCRYASSLRFPQSIWRQEKFHSLGMFPPLPAELVVNDCRFLIRSIRLKNKSLDASWPKDA